jgi:hypothetical protein
VPSTAAVVASPAPWMKRRREVTAENSGGTMVAIYGKLLLHAAKNDEVILFGISSVFLPDFITSIRIHFL